MFIEREQFRKLLQENEARIYWKSGGAALDAIIHEWRLIEDDSLILKEFNLPHERLYWCRD